MKRYLSIKRDMVANKNQGSIALHTVEAQFS